MGALISASITPVLAPLVVQLEADRQMIERQTDTIREQAETIGTLRAELAAEQARYGPVAGQETASPVETAG